MPLTCQVISIRNCMLLASTHLHAKFISIDLVLLSDFLLSDSCSIASHYFITNRYLSCILRYSSPSLGMQDSTKFKHAILKNLLLGLRKCGVTSRVVGFSERKSAIRHAADAALADARGAAPCWSRSLAAELSHGRHLGPSKGTSSEGKSSKMMCKRISRRRSLRPRRKSKATAKAAGVLARDMVRRRARALREIVPGGRGMDECTLLGETLDYAVSLEAQVNAMQLLLQTLHAPKKNTTR
uniref:IBH1-like N-terminal domain-containing protein n=1 Tax=Arundo donax TaxID=35708 RepID=A0A0A9BT68_ARUDO